MAVARGVLLIPELCIRFYSLIYFCFCIQKWNAKISILSSTNLTLFFTTYSLVKQHDIYELKKVVVHKLTLSRNTFWISKHVQIWFFWSTEPTLKDLLMELISRRFNFFSKYQIKQATVWFQNLMNIFKFILLVL